MQLLKNGARLSLLLALLSSGCRKDQPPAIDICIGDGFGGANCTLIFGSPLIPKCTPKTDGHDGLYWCPPTALGNSWITTEESMKLFSSWCYKTSPDVVEVQMNQIRESLK